MNILLEQILRKNCTLFPNLNNDDYTLCLNGYSFTIASKNIDYPIIDKYVYKLILKELEILKYLRIS